ncbi:hypothetical protein N7537_002449 [Penicillium hordei]|uniref:Uncharacterized protein n=1 Tax=Penicillium hordei TaxID=40994 RepID=A0AAD6EIN8_9EURO|nr:uncharacterized protein N7537_002449 [Penicillium hordei]KAJ5617335.1 hypothetical protein N7537_002449 [Penicillium hordei]
MTEESSDEASLKGANHRVPREPVERLITLIKFLESYNKEVEQIESALGELPQKDEKIQRLSAKVKELEHSKNEESRVVEEEERRLMELQNKLNEEKASLQKSRQTLDQESKNLEGEKQRLKADALAKYEKAIATERKKLEDELQTLIKQNEKATAAKFEQAERTIRELQGQVSAQTETKEDTERTLTLFKAHTKQLEDQKKDLEARFKTQDSPLSEFEEDLSKISKALKAIAHAYFGDLPLDDSDIDQSQRHLRASDPIFEFVPLTASVTSKYLRARAAQTVITKAICHSLWQHFSGSKLPLSPDQISAFVHISEALARRDRKKENVWRYLTYQGLDVASLPSTRDSAADNQLVLQETKRLSELLGVLIPQQKLKEFGRDLGRLLSECVRFWNKAKRDSCIVEFDTDPPKLGSSGWLSEPCPELDYVEGSTEQGRDEVQAWCLFPRITFKPVNEKPKVVAGSAVFSDCPAFHEGSSELKRQEEQLAQWKRQFARQPSVSKGR